VLTVADVIRMPFFHDRSLLADLMKCGVQMVSEVLSWFKKVSLEAGYVVVLETAGRAGTWNPHLHILMTSGGVTPVEAGGYRLESGGAADGTLFGPLGLVVTYALDCRLV
jgi:hypothetical protein